MKFAPKWLSKRRVFLDAAGGMENPSAVHAEGTEAKRKLEDSRARIAKLLRCGARDVVFTSGGTESDNLAVLGVFEAARGKVERPRVVISSIEHPAVVESAREAERRGAEVVVVPVREDGTVDPKEVIRVVNERTILVSVSLADGVTGAVQPVQKISRLMREYRKKNGSPYPYIHTDATQAAPYADVSVEALGADLLTLDSSKLGGPKCGVLVVRPSVLIRPIMFGGSQERGLRPGTEDVSAIGGFADALERLTAAREVESRRLMELREFFVQEIEVRMPEIVVRGSKKESLPNIVAVFVPGILSEFLAVALDQRGIAVSSGSACASEGDTDDSALLRFSFDKETSREDILRSLDALEPLVRRAKMGA